MNFRPLLALSLLLGSAGAAPALAQSQDGCIRLPSSMSLVIVIPPEGCGTALMAERRGDPGPTIIYGTLPARLLADNGGADNTLPEAGVISYSQTNVSIAIVNSNVRAEPRPYFPHRPMVAAKRLPKGKATVGYVANVSPGKAQGLR